MQVLPAAWDTRARRWFFVDTVRPANDWLHWARGGHTWNTMCADCHSTGLRKRYDDLTDRFATTFAEISVGCEACHGPGAEHAAQPSRSTATHGVRGPALVEQCATCHSRRAQLADQGTPGQPLLDRYLPSLLSAGVYYPDGQILDEDFEAQSFWQSKMYSKGVACNDCHDVHSGRLRAEGNALCTRCHDPARFDTPLHHRHREGSRCVDCHMPSRTYMVVHVRRDHSLRIPRPDLADSAESPSACAGCHAERSAAELASAFRGMYGDRVRPVPWGPLLAAGRRGDRDAEQPLATLALDRARPAIVRASALELLGGYTGEASRAAVEHALADADPLVRATAASQISSAELLRPLCSDPIRAVRMAAAERLAGIVHDAACVRALDELIAGQRFMSDMPSGPFTLGNVFASLGRAGDAEREYRRAIALDGQRVEPKISLAMLLDAEQRGDEAEALLREAVDAQPDLAIAAFDLGLLLAERGKRSEAEQALRRALAVDPTLDAAAYNLGVLIHDDRPDEARELFRRAASLRPDELRYVQAASR